MKATIHQPDFLPWMGLFNKIAKADCWIVLDHVLNNPRDAAFWGRRVRILVNGEPTWLSVTLDRPAEKGALGVPINEMTINLSDPKVMARNLRTLQMAYAAAPHFSRYFPLAEAWFLADEPNLMRRNMGFIEAVMKLLGVTTRIVYSSRLGSQAKSTQLLVELLKEVGAQTYLCGGGAQGYQEDELFSSNALQLEYNRFQHPHYPQLRAPEFVPGLSILDALFCVGEEQVADWVRGA